MRVVLNIILVLLVPVAVTGHAETAYRVRSTSSQRRTQDILDSNEYVYTHSDDGKSKQLDSFLVDIFETAGNLGAEDLVIVRGAMNKFLLTELNAIYEPENNDLDAVSSEISQIASLNLAGGTSRNLRTLNGNTPGTELDMTVTLSFDNEPSPSSPELELRVEQIMQDLTYFVTNLTELVAASSVGNTGLALVTVAERRDYPSESPTQAPVDNTDAITSGNTDSGSNNTDRNNIASTTVATALAGLTLLAATIYLVFRRKKRSDPESPKGDMMYVDVEGDLYSMDRSLESSQSPMDVASPSGDHGRYSIPVHPLSPTAGDSVFSGLADSPPSKHTVRTTKSLMSGYTNASASTIRVSNMDRASKLHAATKSHSAPAHGSLFAFSEEEYGNYDSEGDDDLVFGRGGLPHMEKSDVSDDSDVERVMNPEDVAPSPSEASSCLQGTAIEQPAGLLPKEKVWCGPTEKSSAEIVQDLALESSVNRHAPRDPTPTVSGAIKRDPTPRADLSEVGKPVVSYNPFNCNPIIPEDSNVPYESDTDEIDELQTPKPSEHNPTFHSSAKVTRKPEGNTPILGDYTPNSQSVYTPGVSSTMETPLKRNTALTPSSAAASAGARRTPKSASPAQVQVEWENDVEAPGTVGAMAAKAATMLGGVFGDGGATAGSRSRTSTMDGGSKPGTPKSTRSVIGSRSSTPTRSRTTTPTKDESPGSPQGNRLGRHWLRGGIPGMAASPPPGSEDYVDNLSRPSTPGGEFNSSLQVSDYAPEYSCLPFGRVVDRAPKSDESEAENLGLHGGRRHAGNKLGGDGSAMYQTNAMHPLDWSYKSADIASIGESTISEHDGAGMPSRFIFSRRGEERTGTTSPGGEPKTPMSESSARTGGTTKGTNESSHSASRQLINDLVWLEKKIADVRQTSSSALVPSGAPTIEAADSMSYVSNDDACISSSSNDSQDDEDPTVYTNKNDSVMSSIVCRDCYAPPGKLHIVIHSTKDGPAVHTVKEGSSLEGHIFPGDLIISVDNVDTRSFTAEQVMKMMAAKGDRERKITVLHFEEED